MKELSLILKKLRIENGEVLADMAKKLGISIAMLSQIENGKRNVQRSFVKNLAKNYKSTLSKEQLNFLENVEGSLVNDISINLQDASSDKRKVALKFEELLNSGDDKKMKDLYKLLKENE